jgi:hypothetical protein
MTTPTLQRMAWWQVALALLPGLFLLVGASNVLETRFGMAAPLRWLIAHTGLLWLCVALCGLGYARERQLPVWSLPALGIALVMLLIGAGSKPAMVPWGALLVVVALAAVWQRPMAGRSWEFWLVALLPAGAVLFSFAVPYNPGPAVEPSSGLVRLLLAALSLPQNAFLVTGLLGVFAAVFAWRLAPREGLRAALLPVGTLIYVWSGIGDPAYALGMWTESQALVVFMTLLPALTLVATTLAVAIAPSRRAQWAAILTPISAGLLTEIVVDLAVRPYASLGHSLLIGLGFYLLPLLLALWLCARPLFALRPPPAAGMSAL